MKKLVVLIILSCCFSFAESETDLSIKDYTRFGFSVPTINTIYVDSFVGNQNVFAVYKDGTIIVKKGSESLRAIRHEIAHAISIEVIKNNKELFKAYSDKRLASIKVITTYYHLTGDELGYVFKLLKWFYNVTTTEEIVAEDLYYYVYRLDTLQKDYIGVPTTENIEELLTLIDVNLIYLNKEID